MKRISLRQCLGGAGLVALVLGAGCTHAPVQQVAQKPGQTVPATPAATDTTPAWRRANDFLYPHDKPSETGTSPSMVMASESKKTNDAQASAATLNSTSVDAQAAKTQLASAKLDTIPFMNPTLELPKLPPVKNNLVSAPVASTTSVPAVPTEPKPLPSPTTLILPLPTARSAATAKRLEEASPIKQAKLEIVNAPAPPALEPAAVKKTAPETTLFARNGHAPNYSWVCGQLEYSRYHKNWRLRYAGLDEVDAYGGSVTLTEDVRTAGLKDGQHVRLEGRLVNPGPRDCSAVRGDFHSKPGQVADWQTRLPQGNAFSTVNPRNPVSLRNRVSFLKCAFRL